MCDKSIKCLSLLAFVLGIYLLAPDSVYGQTQAPLIKYNPMPMNGSTPHGPVYEWNGLFNGEWPADTSIIIIPLRAAQTTGNDIDELLSGTISYTNKTITHQFYANIGTIKLCVIDEYGFIHIGKYVDTAVATSDLTDISILPERPYSIFCVLPNGERYYHNFTIEE